MKKIITLALLSPLMFAKPVFAKSINLNSGESHTYKTDSETIKIICDEKKVATCEYYYSDESCKKRSVGSTCKTKNATKGECVQLKHADYLDSAHCECL